MDRGEKDLVVVGQEKDAAAAADTPPPAVHVKPMACPDTKPPQNPCTRCVSSQRRGGEEKRRAQPAREHCAPRRSKSRWHGGWGDGGYRTDHRLPV